MLVSARRDAPEVGDAHHPRSAGEDDRFAAETPAVGVEVGAREEQDREHSINNMEELRRAAPKSEGSQAEQALKRGQAGHDQVARTKAPRHLGVAKVAVRSPNRQHEREEQQRPCAHAVK
jgi:hypothetical protein